MIALQYKLWDKKNKRWYDEDNVLLERDGALMEYHYDCFENLYVIDRTNDFIVVPYTGLKDKRGKKIHEGDIVKTDLGNGVVIFDSGAFLVRNLDDDEYYGFDDFFSLYEGGCYLVEVIGNVFENPELL